MWQIPCPRWAGWLDELCRLPAVGANFEISRRKRPKTEPNRDRTRGVSKKLSYKHQREWDGMEEQILLAEQDLAACQARVEDPAIAVDSAKLNKAFEDLKFAQGHVEKLYERWSELEAMQQLQ